MNHLDLMRSIAAPSSVRGKPAPRDGCIDHAQRLAAVEAHVDSIAHDLNNVVATILGYCERALRDAARGSRLHRDLEMILAAGECARSLIEQVVADPVSDAVEHTVVDIDEVVREALDLLTEGLPSGITVLSELRSGGAAAYGCPIKVHRVFMNLAINAVQAMPRGGTLRVSVATESVAVARSLTVGTVTSGDYVVLTVADSGTGIAPDLVRRIFDQYFSTKKTSGGTGLGLSIVREIVIDTSGAIAVESEPDVGSTFTVYLPRARAAT